MAPESSPSMLAALHRQQLSPPAKPIHMLMIARRRGDRLAWAVYADDGWSASSLCPPGTRKKDAWLLAAERILSRLAELREPVWLEFERQPFYNIGPVLEAVAGVVAVTEVYRGELFHRAVDDVERALAQFPDAPLPNPPRPFVIATDGSYGHREGGWAWLGEDGQFRARSVRCSDPLEVELIAIYQALLAHRDKPRELAIVSDSVVALSYLDPDRYGPHARDVRPTTALGAKATGRARALLGLRKHPVRFIWVRSHTGHPLNEGADRLAVGARRAKGLSRDTTMAATLEGIAAEAIEGWAPIRRIWWASPEATGRPPAGTREQAAEVSGRASAH